MFRLRRSDARLRRVNVSLCDIFNSALSLRLLLCKIHLLPGGRLNRRDLQSWGNGVSRIIQAIRAQTVPSAASAAQDGGRAAPDRSLLNRGPHKTGLVGRNGERRVAWQMGEIAHFLLPNLFYLTEVLRRFWRSGGGMHRGFFSPFPR